MIRKNDIRNKAANPPENKTKPATPPQPQKKQERPAPVDCDATSRGESFTESFIGVVTSPHAALEFHDGTLAHLVAGQVFTGNYGFRVISGKCVALAGSLPVLHPFIAMPVSDGGLERRDDGVGYEPIYDCKVFHAAMVYVPGRFITPLDSTLWGFFRDYSAISVAGAVVLPPAAGSGEICRPDAVFDRAEGDARLVILGLKSA